MSDGPFTPGREGRFAFISHSHADRGPGFELLAPLAKEGFQLWYDEGLTPTAEWRPELRQMIADSSLFILLVSRVSVNRDEVVNETLTARELGVPILALHLSSTPLPRCIEFLGEVQGIEVVGRTHDDVMGKVRHQLVAHQITLLAPADDAGEEWGWGEEGAQDESLKPAMDAGDTSLTSAFADRIPESEALVNSVAHQRAALRGERPVNVRGQTNVLVFYGGAGVGKSGLSRKLERWVSGRADELGHWGAWPGGPVVAVRWDFNDSAGDVQYARLMRSVRQALAGQVEVGGEARPILPRPFLRFDLALAAYLEAVSSRDRQTLGLTGRAAGGLLSSLQEIAAKQKAGVPGELSAANVQQIVDRALRQGPQPLFEGFSLREFLESCERIPQDSEAPELVARLMYLLTEEIFRMPPGIRPALVFFLDHFERVQRQPGRLHESNLTQIVAASPYCLFVITGRNKLSWADPRRTDLKVAGPARWPWLADQVDFDPRQHSLGRLSPEDTEDLYTRYRAAYGWTMTDELIARLVHRSGGLPLHIEAVLKLALSLNYEAPGRELTAKQLDRDLPEVVIQLMNVLTPKERDAFRAACVLPFFDSRLVEVVGDVHAGDVANAVTYALVEENRDSAYPYRVHDEIRSLVRLDRSSEGYWGGSEWQDAARRGLDEARRRIAVAHHAEADTDETRAVALAVRIAHEWGLETTQRERLAESDLERAVTRAPSLGLLAQLLPSLPPETPRSGIETLIQFVHAAVLPYGQGITALMALRDAPGRAAEISLRFAAYRLRALHRYDEALALLAEVIESFPDSADYTRKQYAMTLRAGRRFVDALCYVETQLPPDARPTRFRVICDRRHGVFDSAATALGAETPKPTKSSRVRHEQDVTGLVVDAYTGRATEEQALGLLEESTRRKYRGGVRTCLRVLGYFHLAEEPRLREIIQRIERGIDEDETNALTVTHLLALRALLTGDPADARAAHESVRPGPRGSVSIPVEVWLEELGYPLEPVPTQWLIPYEQVRANWLKVAEGIIERAGEMTRVPSA